MPEPDKVPPETISSQPIDLVMATFVPPQRTAPPLSIMHLVVFTTGFAVFMGLENFIDYLLPQKDKAAVHWIAAVIQGIAFGIIMATPWLLYQIKQTSGNFFVHGGHWLLPFMMFVLLFGLTDRLVFKWAIGANSVLNLKSLCIYYLVSAGLSFLGGAIAIFIAIFVAGIYRWLFVAMATQYLIYVVHNLVVCSNLSGSMWLQQSYEVTQGIFVTSLLIKALPLLVVVLLDFLSKKRRDWIHWAGVMAFGIYSVSVHLMWFVYGFFR